MEHRHINLKDNDWNAAAVHSVWERGTEQDICALIRQLAEPKPGDLDQIDLSTYKGIQPPFDSWDFIVKICEKVSVELGDRV